MKRYIAAVLTLASLLIIASHVPAQQLGVGLGLSRQVAGGPVSFSVTADAAGTSLTVTWPEAKTYSAGNITVYATNVIGMTASRQIATTGAPSSGNGTATHVYDLQDGKPINQGEMSVTCDVPNNFVTPNHGVVTGEAVTNSSTLAQGMPVVQVVTPADIYSGTTAIEVQAIGLYGTGDGVASVDISVDDGVTTLGPTNVTSRSDSAIDGYNCFIASFNLASLNDGALTVTATANGENGLGSRSETLTIYNNSTSGYEQTIYVATSGNDTTGDGTSGNQYATIGKAFNDARAAGDTFVEIVINEAGTYNPERVGGLSFGTASGIAGLIRSDAGIGAEDAVIQANTTTFRPNQQVPISWSRVKIDLQDSVGLGRVELYDEMYFRPDVVMEGPGETVSGATAVLFRRADGQKSNMRGSVTKCDTTGGAYAYRTASLSRMTGDATQNSWVVVNCDIDERKAGEPAFTCNYTGTGNGRLTKTGGAEDAGGTGIWELYSNGSSVATFDSDNVLYDTMTELETAIDGVTDWTMTLEAGADGTWDSGNPFAFDHTFTGTTPVIHYPTNFHSDTFQFFVGSAQDNILYHNNTSRLATGLGEGGGGSSSHQQFWWFDHAGPLDVSGVAVFGNMDWQQNATATPRSAFHGVMKDCIIGYNTIPANKIGLIYGGGATSNSEFTPTNFVLTGNVAQRLQAEGSHPSRDSDGADVYHLNNTWGAAASGVTYDATESTVTIADELANFRAGMNRVYNLRSRTGTDLDDRAETAIGLEDLDGVTIAANGFGGAYQTAVADYGQSLTFTSPASTGIDTVSLDNDLWHGTTPEALLVFHAGLSADGVSTHAGIGFGFGTSSTVRSSMHTTSRNALSSVSDTWRRHTEGSVLTHITNVGATHEEADIDSFNADDFRLDYTTVNATAYIYNALVLGGSGFEFDWRRITPSGVGNQAYTGTGFQPDALICFSMMSSAAVPTTEVWRSSCVVGIHANSQDYGTSFMGVDNVATSQTATYSRESFITSIVDDLEKYRADVVSLDADGYTLNYLTASGSDKFWVLALSAPNATVVVQDQPTADGVQRVAVGFEPRAALFISPMLVSSTSVQQDGSLMGIGVWGPGGQSSIAYADEDAQTTTDADRVQESAACMRFIDFTQATVGKAYARPAGTDLLLEWADCDGTAREYAALILGW